MSRSATTLVAEIKTAYARTTADKLVIQKDMASCAIHRTTGRRGHRSRDGHPAVDRRELAGGL